ncbi:MAG: SH3 domain-containing protein [Anaerolineaceae bacterium]|nr:SH3 domain-containing protein [Anaerolineaceae bacterium]
MADEGQGLRNCMVRTTHILNLRAGPGGTVTSLVPQDVTLTAFSRAEGWYEVDYHGARGWISASHVVPQGDCG